MSDQPAKANRKLNKKPARSGKGSCNIGDIVVHQGKQMYVQNILDYCPDMRKSYIKGCSLDEHLKPLYSTDIFAGYDWSYK